MFALNPSSGIPIYRQIVQQARHAIAVGRVKPGERLPSVRAIATELGINPMTVSKAYSMLEQAGVVSLRQPGIGMVVSGTRDQVLRTPSTTTCGRWFRPQSRLACCGTKSSLTDQQYLGGGMDRSTDPPAPLSLNGVSAGYERDGIGSRPRRISIWNWRPEPSRGCWDATAAARRRSCVSPSD